MRQLTLTLGAPGAGKSTWARAQRDADHDNTLILELDRFRTAIFGSKAAYWEYAQRSLEHRVRASAINRRAYRAALKAALDLRSHEKIICADTNLFGDFPGMIIRLAETYSMPVRLVVFDVPFPVLLERNANRPEDDRVEEKFLREYHCAMTDPEVWFRQSDIPTLTIQHHGA